MARLKSYTCSKCAGVLVFDGDQEYFDCPFCGTRFDVLDFHGKNFRLKREKERNELLSKAYPFRVSNKKIEIEFRELRSSITAMRDDSVLCK